MFMNQHENCLAVTFEICQDFFCHIISANLLSSVDYCHYFSGPVNLVPFYGFEGVLHISEVDLLYSLHGRNTISVMLLTWTFADSFHPLYCYGYPIIRYNINILYQSCLFPYIVFKCHNNLLCFKCIQPTVKSV